MSEMTYLEVYGCKNCPVAACCGTMIQSIRLCHSYQKPKLEPKEITLSTIIIK